MEDFGSEVTAIATGDEPEAETAVIVVVADVAVVRVELGVATMAEETEFAAPQSEQLERRPEQLYLYGRSGYDEEKAKFTHTDYDPSSAVFYFRRWETLASSR